MGKAFLLLMILGICFQPIELEIKREGIEGSEEGGGVLATGSRVTRKAKDGRWRYEITSGAAFPNFHTRGGGSRRAGYCART